MPGWAWAEWLNQLDVAVGVTLHVHLLAQMDEARIYQVHEAELFCVCAVSLSEYVQFSQEVIDKLGPVEAGDGPFHSDASPNALVYRFEWLPKSRCAECGGSGEYVGFTVREACGRCEGRGFVAEPVSAE